MNFQAHRRRLTGQRFEGAVLRGLDLRGALAESSVWVGCSFDGVDFGQAALGNATFEGCQFSACRFGQATLVARFYSCQFTHCDFGQALFAGADVRSTTFRSCEFPLANFTRATLNDTDILDCDLHGAILDFAVTKNVDFTGSSLWSAVIPLNCAMFSGNIFDRKQVHQLISLLLHGQGEWRSELLPVVDPRIRKVVDRLVSTFLDEEGSDQGGQAGVVPDGGVEPEVAPEANAERDRVVPSGEGRFPRRVDPMAGEEQRG